MIISQLKQDMIPADKIYSSLKTMEQIQELLKRNDEIIKDLKSSKQPFDIKFYEMESNLRQVIRKCS